jgi:septal ring-binding cell division protein DamX
MGKVAGTVLAAAAPEAKLASAAVGGARGGKRTVPDPRVTAPGSRAAQQRQAIEDMKASRPAPAHPMVPTAPAGTVPSPSSPGGGPSLQLPGAAATGSGFLLGLFAWALALAYLRGGPAEVRKFLRAKFLNDPEGKGPS